MARRVVRRTAVALAVLLLLVLMLGVGLLGTDRGARVVLRLALPIVEGQFEGRFAVHDIRTSGLWQGLTLVGVAVTDLDGRPAVSADSMQVHYRVADLVRKRIRLSGAQVWGARVVISQSADQSGINLERIFAPRQAAPAQPAAGESTLEVTLTDASIHGADLIVELPAPDDADSLRQILVQGQDGRLMQRIHISDVNATIPLARVVAPDQEGEAVELSALSANVQFFPSPFRVDNLTGSVRRVGSAAQLEGTVAVERSAFAGSVGVEWGGGTMGYDISLESDRFDPSDFRFFDPRLPSGLGQGRITARSADGEATFSLLDGLLTLGRSRIQGDATVHLGPDRSVSLQSVDLELAPLELDLLDPFAGDLAPVPLDLTGPVRLDGPLEELAVAARIRITSPENRFGPSIVEVDGGVHAVAPLGLRDLRVDASTLSLALVRAFWPPLPVGGLARVRGRIDGTISSALDLDLALTHLLSPDRTSRVRYAGLVDRRSDDVWLEGDLTLDTLHLRTLEPVHEVLGADESAVGTIGLSGRLGALEVDANLNTTAGSVTAAVLLNGSDLAAGYRADMELGRFEPGRFMAALSGTVLTGTAQVDLVGIEPATMAGSVQVELIDSDLMGLRFDSVQVSAALADGYLDLAPARSWTSGGTLEATGSLGLLDSNPPGEITVSASFPSLSALTSRWMAEQNGGGPRPAQELLDPASNLEEAGLVLEGSARVDATLQVAGSQVGGHGRALGLKVETGPLSMDSLEVRFEGSDLAGQAPSAVVTIDAWPLHLFAGSFDRAQVTVDVEEGAAAFEVGATAGDSIRHSHAGRLTTSDSSSALTLHRVELHLNDSRAAASAPASLEWGPGGLVVEPLRMTFEDDPSRQLVVGGQIPRDGPLDFTVDVRGLGLQTLASLMFVDESVGGTLDLDLRISGSSNDPVLDVAASVDALAFRGESLPQVRLDADYESQLLTTRLEALDGGQAILAVALTVPADLRTGAPPRILDAPMEGTVALQRLPLGLIATLPGVVEDVDGTISGQLKLGGPVRAPALVGGLAIDSGSMRLPALGVAPRASGELTFSGDGIVGVDVTLLDRGMARIAGTVDLTTVTQPGFDLAVSADTFRVLNRADVSSAVSGSLTLGGDMDEPHIVGEVTTRDATVRLDALARSRQVADITDADFYSVVDTSVFVRGGSVAPSLIDRAAIDLGLRLGTGSWLRSRDINAELEGAFRVRHEPLGEFSLNGELRTVRGAYSGFGKTFQVVEGSILFAGSSSFDPVLNVVTRTRVRSSEQALDIFATLRGTATAPQVELSSNVQPPMAQEELVSYLVFGRPSYQLGSGEDAVVGSVTGAASSMALGMVANELGSALGSSIGMFDYFTISAPQEVAQHGQGEAMRSSIASTQVEFGQYLTENLFLAAIFRPLDSSSQFAGGRLEWRFRDGTTLEVFLEDQLARSPSATFGDLGFTLEQSLGMSLAKEWIY